MNKIKNFWDEKFSSSDYIYWSEPNVFLKDTLDSYNLAWKIFLLAEWEGRNAVYSAKNWFDTYAFDMSNEWRKKALSLAKIQGVEINYEVWDFLKYDFWYEKFDVLALIYAHFHPSLVRDYHKKAWSLLKSWAMIILEWFSKNNLEKKISNPKIGWPDNIDMLFSIEEIKKDFSDF